MSIKKDSAIKYPYEYIAAQIEFGLKIASLTKEHPIEVFKRYTGLYGTLTNHKFADNNENYWIIDVLKKFESYILKFKSPKVIAKKVYELYLTIPLDKYDETQSNELHFGCFRLNNSDYYKKRNEVRLHFAPKRKGLFQKDPSLRVSDLSSVYFEDRLSEFNQMIKHIHENKEEFDGVTHFVSCTWLQNISTYRSLFPESEKVSKVKVDNGYVWIWGQFLKWDLSGNIERLATFRKALSNSKSLDEALDAIPFPIYEVKVPLEMMFEKYILGYKTKE